MFTFGMSAGDILINEQGQPAVITGRNKIIQDINEALNSSFNANKKFGGRIIDLDLTYDEVYDEIDTILQRLIATQKGATYGEKIKSIDAIRVLKRGTVVYAYIEVTSNANEKVSNDYVILGS